MLAGAGVQAQRIGERVDDARRRRPVVTLLQSRVIRDAHPSQRCELLPAQAGDAATPAVDEADISGLQLLTAERKNLPSSRPAITLPE